MYEVYGSYSSFPTAVIIFFVFLVVELLIREKKYFVELFFNNFTKLIWQTEGMKKDILFSWLMVIVSLWSDGGKKIFLP